MVEGTAAKLSDEGALRRVAAAYASKYGSDPDVRGGALDGVEGAPTAGPPPYDAYRVSPTTILGLPTDLKLAPTRWRFY